MASLFREEVIAHRADRLHGDVNLAMPVSWQIIGYGLLGALVVSATFLSLASYARVETVSGSIVTDRGVATIVPTRAGVIDNIGVRENDIVAAKTPLVRISADNGLSTGVAAQESVIDSIREQDKGLALQSRQLSLAALEDQSRLGATAAGLKREIASIGEQLVVERQLVDKAKEEFDRAEKVAANGFISRHDLQVREETWLTRRQQVSQLEATRASKAASVLEAERSAAGIVSQARAQAAGLSASRAELSQRSITTDSARAFTISAPVAGRVTALTARIGQPVNPQTPLLVIVPSGSRLRAELTIPTNAAGFLAVGQEVRLAVDAFAYQRFGTVKARIEEISATAVPRVDSKGATVPVYLVTARIADPSVMAFGRKQPLLPGMTLSARIVTEKQTLIEWLFEPLFAVRNR